MKSQKIRSRLRTRFLIFILASCISSHASSASPTQVVTDPSPLTTLMDPKQGLLLPVREAGEDWSAARSLVASNKSWAAWVEGNRSLLVKWFSKPRDRAELVAGYVNGLVDPATGAAVQWSMDMPEPPVGGTPAEMAYRGAWVAINRQYNHSRALDAARQYQLTGDTHYAELAATQLDFYAKNYLRWPLRTAIGNARMMGQSLDEATSVLTLLEAVSALRNYAGPTRLQLWHTGLFNPIATNLQTYSWGTLNNINLWCAVATAAIGLTFNDQTLINLGTNGPKGISSVLRQGVTEDGIWYEGSFAYNNYVIAALARFFDIAAANGRSDLVVRYASETQQLLLAPILYRFDDGTLPSPSDTRMPVRPVDLATHFSLYRHIPTSIGISYALTKQQWVTLMDPPNAVIMPPILPPPVSVHSQSIRMAMLRMGSWQLFVHYGQNTINHAQEEALTYELVDGDTSITRDAGTATSYMSGQHLNYFSKGVGNNVPLVDGQGQEKWSPGEVKSFNTTNGTLDVLHSTYRSDVSARRNFKLTSGGMTETTRIALTKPNAKPRRLGVIFNTVCDVEIDDPRAGAATPSVSPLGSPGFSYWTDVVRYQAQPAWAARLNCNGQLYEMTISGPAGHFIYLATVPNTPLPSTRKAVYVESLGTEVSFTTSIRAF